MDRAVDPRLIAVDGPHRGQSFAVDKDAVAIGRESGNTVALDDSAVSRRHCVIRKEPDGRFTIHDLNSRNGTFVNGLPVGERVLNDGDEIRVGNCLFAFLVRDRDAGSLVSVSFDQEELDTGTILKLREENSVYLRPHDLLDTPAVQRHLGRALPALLKISAGIQIARGTDALARQLLESIFEAVPARDGAILLFEPGSDAPAWACTWNRDTGSAGVLHAHLPIVHRSWRERIAILSKVRPRESSDSDEGAPNQAPRYVLVVPLVALDKTLGVIYLDSGDPRVRFGEEHLQLVTAIGGMCGLAIENARRLEWLEAENQRLRDEIDIEHDMVGAGERMRDVYRFVAKVAPTESTVLLHGESGTGKELVARAIHRNSRRTGQPFAAINCATLMENLLESELFGHEKGAFTGAVALRKGKFEAAAGGTVFLDEVGELPLPMQAKLLRVLQEREFERVGGTHPIQVDIRLIAATNRDLKDEVARGAFRKDLYYRLNVVSLTLPPLRERREDIAMLAAHFVSKYGKRTRRKVSGISQEALACLLAYDWPGNVRELENAIERALVLGSSEFVLPEDLPEAVTETASAAGAAVGKYQETIREEKKRLILACIDQAGGSFTEAARLLGVHPNYLHRLVRNLNLRSALK